jgi:hypothetical protein
VEGILADIDAHKARHAQRAKEGESVWLIVSTS